SILFRRLFFFFILLRPPSSTLFPYTTLFRSRSGPARVHPARVRRCRAVAGTDARPRDGHGHLCDSARAGRVLRLRHVARRRPARDRKSTRLNSSHSQNSYALFCLKKKYYEAL